MRPQPTTVFSSDRATAMNQIYGKGSAVDISHRINKPITRENAMRAASLGMKAAGGIVPFTVHAFILQPLKYALIDYVSQKIDPQTSNVVFDKYTESIVAEALSYQQPKSKLQSASKFIRPKKKEIIYK
ncbi:hypothetical protein ES705_35529 [subsurface metagenome]